MRADTFKDFLIGVSFILIQVLIFQHLSFYGATPDLLIIFLLWLAPKYDRVKLILFAASLGFIQDALFDLWGLNMFVKTFLFFILYNFIYQRKESRLLSWQVFTVVLLTALMHNILFLGLASFMSTYSPGFSPIIFVLFSSLYTALIGSMIFIFKGN